MSRLIELGRRVRSLAERGRQRGQTLALFAVMLPGIFAFCALGLDAGNLYVERREMQAAADLAALAGARLLPDAVSATARANSIAAANGYSSGVTVTTPYATDPLRIEVRIAAPVRTFFLPVLGVTSMDVAARSVALRTPAVPPNPYALFAGLGTCAASSTGLKWTGDDSLITGLVHSNSNIKISSGRNAWLGGTTYKCAGGFENTGIGNIFTPLPVQVPADIVYPLDYTWDDFCPGDFYNASGIWDLTKDGPWWVGGSSSSLQLMPGVYCADGATAEITLNKDGVVGNVTFVSRGKVALGGLTSLTAYKHNISMAAYGAGARIIERKPGATLPSGTLFAPNGEIIFSGPTGSTYIGSLVGQTISVTGSKFVIVASNFPGVVEALQLVE